VKQKKRERLRGKNKLRSLFLFQKVNDRQKMVKKDKEKGGNLLKNTVCKRLTYNCGNGILQVKET